MFTKKLKLAPFIWLLYTSIAILIYCSCNNTKKDSINPTTSKQSQNTTFETPAAKMSYELDRINFLNQFFSSSENEKLLQYDTIFFDRYTPYSLYLKDSLLRKDLLFYVDSLNFTDFVEAQSNLSTLKFDIDNIVDNHRYTFIDSNIANQRNKYSILGMPLINSNNNVAVVHIGYYCGILCSGAAYYVYMQDGHGKWKKIGVFGETIS